MNRVRNLTVIGVLCVFAGVASGGSITQTWLSWDDGGVASLNLDGKPTSPTIGAHSGGLAGFGATVSTAGLSVNTVVNEAGTFVELGWPDAAWAGEIGAPRIPVLRRLFIAPAEAEFTVSYDAGPPVVIDGAALGAPLRLLPAQPPIPMTPGAKVQFKYDPPAYALDAELPAERAVIEEVGIVRGQRVCLLEIRPIAYNPAQQRVFVYPQIDVRVDFVGPGYVPDTLSVLPGLRSIVLNPDLLPPRGLRGEGNYLIVVANQFEGAIASFADAKAAQGYMVSTYVVPDDTTQEQIKLHVLGLWGGPESPAYILLVGDTNTIPHWVGIADKYAPTDLYYACMDGAYDWYPDIAIGRFPVRNTAQLASVVDKTLYYETGSLADPDYLLRAVFMATPDNQSWDEAEATHDWVIDTYMTPNNIVSDKLYAHTYGAGKQQVRDAFNGGRFFGVYAGHGAYTEWDAPEFQQPDVNALINENMYAFVVSLACWTGGFTVEECFLETWVRAANKGAVAAWGASVESYWPDNFILEKKLFDSIYDGGDDVVCEAGPVVNDAKLRYRPEQQSETEARYIFEMYNLLGDPALPLEGPHVPAQGLWTTPLTGFTPEGQPGGPFTPPGVDYVLRNQNTTPLDYTVTKTADWLRITNPSGTIPAQSSANVSVALNALAGAMPPGTYMDTLIFTNLTNHDGDTTRPVRLTVGVPVLQYAFDLNTNPGWTVTGVPDRSGWRLAWISRPDRRCYRRECLRGQPERRLLDRRRRPVLGDSRTSQFERCQRQRG